MLTALLPVIMGIMRKRKLAAAVKRHYKRIRSQQLPKKLF